MKPLSRSMRVHVALGLLTLASALGGCATTQSPKQNKQITAEAKHKKPQSIRALTGSYALSDETTAVESAILQRGARARGTDYGY